MAAMRFTCSCLLFAVTACVSYGPVVPRTGVQRGTRARIERLTHILGAYQLTLRVEQAAPGSRVREAVLARAEAEPCRFGWAPARATLVAPDRAPVEADEYDVRAGDELVLLYSQENSKEIERGVRLDLLIVRGKQEECLTIPLTGSAPELAWDPGDGLSMDFAMGGSGYSSHVDGVAGDLDFRLALGWSMGTVRPFLGAGVGVGFCERGTCPPKILEAGTDDERDTPRVGLATPLFIGTDLMPWQVGYFAFGASVAYELTHYRMETYAGGRTSWLHGTALAPRAAIAFKDPLAPGLPGGVRNGFVALDVPLGFAVSLRSGDLAFRPGLRLVLSCPLG